MNKILTIFTPTYNRAYSLPQLYNSMLQQESNNFVWLIVDDGSTDHTKELVARWQADNLIDIVYLYQSNSGKMCAHNRGVISCRTPLFFCIDSDDYLTFNTINSIVSLYNKIKDNNHICGILAKRYIINRKSSSNMPHVDYMTLHELYSSGFCGDTSIIFKTDILKHHLFPEIKGEKFITEGYIYDQIDQHYKYMIVDEFFMVCEYRNDGYTVNTLKIQRSNPKGWALYYAQYYSLFAESFRDKVKYMGYYIAYMIQAKSGLVKIFKNSPSFFFCLISIHVGIYFYLRDFMFTEK